MDIHMEFKCELLLLLKYFYCIKHEKYFIFNSSFKCKIQKYFISNEKKYIHFNKKQLFYF